MSGLRVGPGTPGPFGVSLVGDGVNVAWPSGHATAIEFCLFADGRETRVLLPERCGDVFFGHIAPVAAGARYGLRVHGPWAPEAGHRFDPAKLLVDPWARELDGAARLHPAMMRRGEETAGVVPKGIVCAPVEAGAPAQITPWAETVIYELHVRGFTMRHPGVPEALRGTFAGLGHPASVAHLVDLGVTAVELMPPNAWIGERHLAALGMDNYWGYNTIAPLAPDPRLAPGGWAEVRAAIAALAAAGIETIIDMVPNHSGEGDALGPTIGLRGLDNAGFYRLEGGRYVDDTGCGNTLALDRAGPLCLAMDSLRAWAAAGAHGFRFDLAVAMGRRAEGFDAAAPLLAAIGQDPALAARKLIAEPWDIGPGGYRLGEFPSAWGEWNDRFRDDVRRFWRGDGGFRGALATRLAGSADVFAGRAPSRSVNFVVAHDGFTLADLVGYTEKRNLANGEANRDGTAANHSWNNGVEGPSEDPALRAARAGDQRALLASLILARGTPMLAMGSELGQSQGGNNNAYAQDNATIWLDWAGADGGLSAWTRKLIGLRRAFPALRADRFLSGGPGHDPDVVWRDADGVLTEAGWQDPAGDVLVMLLDSALAVVLNRGGARAVHLPGRWRVLADSADPEGAERIWSGEAAARSVVLLARVGTGASDALVDHLAGLAGIAPQWWEVDGTRHDVSAQTKRALLAAMRLPAETLRQARDSLGRLTAPRPLPATCVGRLGTPVRLRLGGLPRPVWLVIRGEDGVQTRVKALGAEVVLPPLPVGRHLAVREDAPDAPCDLIIAPPACYLPPCLAGSKRFGVAAQLYTLRRAGDGGIGDFTTLRALVDATARAGGAAVALNPLHALFPGDRTRASPYHPSDRRFLDPIYIDTGEAMPGAGPVDYPAVWARKRAALEQIYAAGGRNDPALGPFIAAGGADLAHFTAFETGGAPEAMRFHAWMQMLADRQLAAASSGLEIGLIRDLAVGAAPDGAEAQGCAAILAQGVSVGAPPDPFSAEGQVWGLPPPDPRLMSAGGYAAFTALLCANLRHAGGLRIDHVMGLARLFWVPEGAPGREGAYVAYPFDDLLGILALESHRAQAMIIGEDLGTVPEGFRERLAAENILGCRVLLLEREGAGFRPAAFYPSRSVASVSTHDLPTLAGWRAGTDVAERAALGLGDGDMAERQAEIAEMDAQVGPDAAAAHGFVAGSPACLVLVQADDLAGETMAVNLPGTDRERPNWRRRLVPEVEALFAQGAPVLEAMRPGRMAAGAGAIAKPAPG